MLCGPFSLHLCLPWEGADTYGGSVTSVVIRGRKAGCLCDCEHPTHGWSPSSHISKSPTALKESFLPPCQSPQVSISLKVLAHTAGVGWDVSVLSRLRAPTCVCLVDLGKVTGQLCCPLRLLSALLQLLLLNIISCTPFDDSALFWNESGMGLTLAEHLTSQSGWAKIN